MHNQDCVWFIHACPSLIWVASIHCLRKGGTQQNTKANSSSFCCCCFAFNGRCYWVFTKIIFRAVLNFQQNLEGYVEVSHILSVLYMHSLHHYLSSECFFSFLSRKSLQWHVIITQSSSLPYLGVVHSTCLKKCMT